MRKNQPENAHLRMKGNALLRAQYGVPYCAPGGRRHLYDEDIIRGAQTHLCLGWRVGMGTFPMVFNRKGLFLKTTKTIQKG
jgi:hypothetical protein